MIGVVFVSDRGDKYLPECRESLSWALGRPDGSYLAHVVDDRDHHLGMAGAVRSGFSWALEQGCDYVLWVEEDFRFVAPVDLAAMVCTLIADPTLAQVVLKRQPWSPAEHQAGGIIECHPDDYTDHKDGDLRWVSHQRIFSLNPCLIPRHILEVGWPDGNEAGMTSTLVELGYRFAFYGERDDRPRVVHVGSERGVGWRL